MTPSRAVFVSISMVDVKGKTLHVVLFTMQQCTRTNKLESTVVQRLKTEKPRLPWF